MLINRFSSLLLSFVFIVFLSSCTPSVELPDEEDINDEYVESSGYHIKFHIEKQNIKGFGVEIQSDAFGPRYDYTDPVKGIPLGIPHDLIPSERKRLATELASGFRYLRLAMGLWFRGVTDDQKNFVERYPGQLEMLKELMEDANMEGISLEYWSPAPYWKSTYGLLGGTLRSYDDAFLDEFGDALARDVQYFIDNGVKVSVWGLQNEPFNGDGDYPQCYYTDENYFKTFKAVAPKIRAVSPEIEIIVDTKNANFGAIGNMLRNDPEALQYVDSWVYHRPGQNSDHCIEAAERLLREPMGRPIYQNEWSYHGEQMQAWSEEYRMVNLAQSIMNWMTFIDSPSWYWLHMLKSTQDGSRFGFGLGIFRPKEDINFSIHPEIPAGTFKYHWPNYNGIAGFMKYMERDSRRIHVEEDTVRYDQRIMCWRNPDGKYAFALTNRSEEKFDFVIHLDKERSFSGRRYSRDFVDYALPSVSGDSIYTIRLEPWSIEFWTEDNVSSSIQSSEDISMFNVKRIGDNFHIEGIAKREQIKMYHLNGQLYKQVTADSDIMLIPMHSNDLILIKAGKNTYKI